MEQRGGASMTRLKALSFRPKEPLIQAAHPLEATKRRRLGMAGGILACSKASFGQLASSTLF
jgi:hypothetical protein